MHRPPTWSLTEESVKSLCDFINDETQFIHPILKAIILHFMIAYIHPFTDGNGRTARSLFYWYMLKKGYWLTEYLAISRIIYRTKAQYERSFQYAEADSMDLNYFITYNLEVMKKAYADLQSYIAKKASEKNAILDCLIPGINERQARIIRMVQENDRTILISRELERTLNVSVKTVRSDLEGLTRLGLLDRVPLNKRLVGYTKSPAFESKLLELSNKDRDLVMTALDNTPESNEALKDLFR